jgi:hypothetical protein
MVLAQDQIYLESQAYGAICACGFRQKAGVGTVQVDELSMITAGL